MKKLFILISVICSFSLFGMKDLDRYDDSFCYARVGGYTLLYYPCGVEAAFGYRHRSEMWGFGPLVNISVSPVALPAISLKFEGLFYPPDWNGVYLGIMPGIGIANSSFLYHTYDWGFCPTCEFVIGKEFQTYFGKYQFYYFSLSPYLTLSFNYGWGF